MKVFLQQKEFKTQILKPLTTVIMAASYATYKNLGQLSDYENNDAI